MRNINGGKRCLVELIVYSLFFVLLSNCSGYVVPGHKIHPYETKEQIEIKDGICTIQISNPLECPLRVWIQNEDKEISRKFYAANPITIGKKSDTILMYQIKEEIRIEKMNYPSRYGDPKMTIEKRTVSLPFVKNSTYKVTQANNGNFSHKDEYSKYAFDFNLETGDTICSTADGFVVGIIDGYSKNGKKEKWRDYANSITIYHPELNLFSQYVHLKKEGSFVKLGDTIKENQPIGLSGNTGYTRGEHLHFAVLKAVETTDGLQSIPINFKEGYIGIELKKNDIVTNKK